MIRLVSAFVHIVLIAAAGSILQAAQANPPLGMAASDYAFYVAGSAIDGSTTIFDGEALSSGYLPAWLDLKDGARYALGIGSQARVFTDRVELEGVSLEIVAAGSRLRRVIAGGLQFVPQSAAARATIYSDRPEVVSIFVAEGEVSVLLVDGAPGARIKRNQSATFSHSLTSPRLQEQRAPLEIARILLRQLDFVTALEDALPALRRERLRLKSYIVRASGGLIGGAASQRTASESESLQVAPAVDAELLLGADVAVGAELHRAVAWNRYGCGDPGCSSPPHTPYRFHGHAADAKPLDAGCVLCRRDQGPILP